MNAAQRFSKQGIPFRYDCLAGIECTIGYVKKFRLRWAATQLNTFIIVGETSKLIDKKRMEQFSTASINYAITNNKGWPRGLQSAVASIAILKGQHIDITAIGFCEYPKKKHFAAFEIPVVYDMKNKTLSRFRHNPIWGRLYIPYISGTIDKLLKEHY